MAVATVFKRFSGAAWLSASASALIAALIYILLDNLPLGELDVACEAVTGCVVVPSGEAIRIPLTLATRSNLPIQLTRIATSCGCTAVEEDEKVTVKLPLRIRPGKSKSCWLAVSTEGRVGEFTVSATFDYQLFLWRRQQSCHLRFRAVPQWFVVPHTLELITDKHNGALEGDLWVFLPQDANPAPKISIDEGPDFISTRVEVIPPDERSRYQVATPSWVADSGLYLAYRIRVAVRTPPGPDKGTVITELRLHTTAAPKHPVLICWSRPGP